MKYILLLLITIGLFSCGYPTVNKTDLPIEVVKLKEQQSFDTLLVIKTEKQTYLFEKNEYIGSYYNNNQFGSIVIFIIILLLFFIIIGITI